MPHRGATVFFSVCEAGEVCDCTFRDNLANEDDASAVAIGATSTDVEAQIYFIEIGVEQNWKNAEKFCAKKSGSRPS